MFPDGKMKAITLSYDDGVEQDRKLVEIINRFGIKATFNLNSGIQSATSQFCKKDVVVRRMNIRDLPKLYEGHEIAVHSLTHPRLDQLDEAAVQNELEQDRINLERIFNTKVVGMAYPFGTYNDAVVQIALRCGLKYGRGVANTHRFAIPQTPLEKLTYQPTCHHNDPNLLALAEQFLEVKPDRPQVFYLWGHSYEFETDHTWPILEAFCRLVGGRDDIFYATNAQALLGE